MRQDPQESRKAFFEAANPECSSQVATLMILFSFFLGLSLYHSVKCKSHEWKWQKKVPKKPQGKRVAVSRVTQASCQAF